MQKQELLSELKNKLSSGEITQTEVDSLFDHTIPVKNNITENIEHKKNISLTKILYTIGAIIVVLGIIFFVAQVWSDMGTFGRLTATLILGFVFAIMGSLLLNAKAQSGLGDIFHTVGGILIPIGLIVTIFEFNLAATSFWPVTFLFGGVFVFYLILSLVQKNVILTFFAFANGTIFLYQFVESIIEGDFYLHFDFLAYMTMFIGISYLIFGYVFRDNNYRKLVAPLNFFGSVFLLGAGFSQVFEHDLWKLLFFVMTVAGVVVSVFLKSRVILIMSTLFLIIHMVYITGEFFANSLGWPLALVILGFIFIGLGYVSININRKFIAGQS